MKKESISEFNWVQFLGLSGLVIFALFAFLGTAIAYIGLGFLLIATLVDGRRAWRTFAGNPVFVTVLALSAYTVARGLTAAQQFPALAGAQYVSLWPWLGLLLFPLTAWWSRGETRRVLFILALAFIGLLSGLARLNDWSHLMQHMRGWRSSFGTTFLDAALYLGSALLGWLAFAPRLIGRGRWRWPRLAGWLIVAGVLLEMLLMTQSRSVLGSLAVLLPAVFLVRIGRTRDKVNRRRRLALAAAFLVVLMALGFFNRGAFLKRLAKTYETMLDVATLKMDQVPYTSLGDRIHLYSFGARQWLRHPAWGWGPGTEAAQKLPDAPVDPYTQERFPHLHNGYLEVLVRFGVAGFMLAAIMAGLIAWSLLQAWRRRDMPGDVAAFFLAVSILAALTNITDFRLIHLYYRFFTILLLGLIYGYTLPRLPLRDS